MEGICEIPQTPVIVVAFLKPEDFSHHKREHPQKAAASGLGPPIQFFQIRPPILTPLFMWNGIQFPTEVKRLPGYPPDFSERSYDNKNKGYVCHYL
jgi:hypothetical protein